MLTWFTSKRAKEALERGETLRQAEDWEAAKQEYQKAIHWTTHTVTRGLPDDRVMKGQAHLGLGRVYLRLEQIADAVTQFTLANSLLPEAWEPLYYRGCGEGRLGNFLKSEDSFTAALTLAPAEARIYCQRGHARFKAGHLETALHDYLAAQRYGKLQGTGLSALAVLYLYRGEYVKAEGILRTLVKQEYLDAYLLLGQTLEKQQKWAESVAIYERAALVNKLAPEACERLGIVLTKLQRYERASVYLAQAIRQGRSNDAALFYYGWVCYHLRRFEQCLHVWTQLKQRYPQRQRLDTLVQKVNLAQQQGDKPAPQTLALLLRRISLKKAAEGDWLGAANSFQEARQVQVADGASAWQVANADLFLVEALTFLLAGQRQEAMRLLEEMLRHNPGDGVRIHSFGLAAYYTARWLELDGKLIEAEQTWHRAIGSWVAILHDEVFWAKWKLQAQERYRADVSNRDAEVVRKEIEEELAKALPEAGGEQQMPNRNGLIERQQRWERLLLRELRAAAILKDCGGFSLANLASEKLICGPLTIQLLGAQVDFGRFVSQLRDQGEDQGDEIMALLRRLLGGESDLPDPRLPDSGQKKQLMSYFSQLGAAQALFDLSRPEDALAALSDAACQRCRAAASTHQSYSRSASQQIVVCPDSCLDFDYFNPGYAGLTGKGDSLRRDAIELAVQAYLALAQSEITAATANTQAACAHWRKGIELSKELGSQANEQTQRRIVEMTLGRAQVLQRGEKLDEAITLLEVTEGVCDDRYGQELVGRLAELLAERGVGACNEQPPRWEPGVNDLRQALSLNPHVARLRANLCAALQLWALQYHQQWRNDAAIGLLEESLRHAQEGLRLTPNHPDLQKQVEEAHVALGAAYNGRGVSRSNAQDWEGALNDLEASLRFNPGDALVEQNLRQVFCNYAIELANRGQLALAIQMIESGLRRFPDDSQMNEMLIQIRLAELLKQKGW